MPRFRLVCLFGLLIASDSVFADPPAPGFAGVWIGTISIDDTEDESSLPIKIEIRVDGSATQSFQDDDGTWNPVRPKSSQFSSLRDNATLTWTNQGGIWSETQVFSLSLVDEQTAQIVWLRHVDNRKPRADGEPWFLTGHGTMTLE